MKLRSLLSKLQSDRAENSIMQTITIAVSAILIAAGLVTAPGLINNARDNNATTDLANIAYAQEFAMATSGKYYSSLETGNVNSLPDLLAAESANGGGSVKYTLSGGVTDHRVVTCEDDFYLLRDTSSSEKNFYRASTSGLTSSDLSKLDIPISVLAACPDILTDIDTTTVTPPTGTDVFASYLSANNRVGTSQYLYSNDTAFASAFPWAVGKTSDTSTSVVTNTRAWVGTTEIPLTAQIGFVEIYGGEVGMEFDNLAADITAAGYTMNQFLSGGWVSLTVNGIPDNHMRLVAAPLGNADGSDDGYVVTAMQKHVNSLTIYDNDPGIVLFNMNIDSPLFLQSQGQFGGVSGSRDYYTSDFGPVVADAYNNLDVYGNFEVDSMVLHGTDGTDYDLCEHTDSYGYSCWVSYSTSQNQQVSRFYINGFLQQDHLPYGSYTDAYNNGDFVYQTAYQNATYKAMAGGVVEIVYNGQHSYFNITNLEGTATGGIYDQANIDLG